MIRKAVIHLLMILLAGQGLAWALQPVTVLCGQGKCHHGERHYKDMAASTPEVGQPCCCPSAAKVCGLVGAWCPAQAARTLRSPWRWQGLGGPVPLDIAPKQTAMRKAFAQQERSRDPGPLFISIRVLLI